MSWILTNRKTNKTRSFKKLETGRAAAIKASAKYGVRYISLRPKSQKRRVPSTQVKGWKEVIDARAQERIAARR